MNCKLSSARNFFLVCVIFRWLNPLCHTTQKMKFSIQDFFSKCDQMEKIFLNGKFHFLCSVSFCMEIIIVSPRLAERFYWNLETVWKSTKDIKQLAASYIYTLFLAWQCEQIWLLWNFVRTIVFTSSQFPLYKSRNGRRMNCYLYYLPINLLKLL